MRALIGRLVVALGLVSLLVAVPANAATATERSEKADILDRLLAIDGVSLIEEKGDAPAGYRYFVMSFTQLVDHHRPNGDTFQQRFTVLHRNEARPTVFHTTGYNVRTQPRRSEPTRIVDGNEISMEYRFFEPSRPDPADWDDLNIWQGASDQHALFNALKPIYAANWLATGASKGGMTATYYERFYPKDMDGIVAYVAPNDVVNHEDSAYDEFFANVGTADCRERLEAVQREGLVRRQALTKRYAELAEEKGYTFNTIGSIEAAYESTVLSYVWGFWQYAGTAWCSTIPADAAAASDNEIWETIDTHAGFDSSADQGLSRYTPYYYQAGTQLGSPMHGYPHIEDKLIRYPDEGPRTYVPRDIDMRFDRTVMRDIDKWVRKNAKQMLFVNGEFDPWAAEPFRLGRKAKDSYVFTAPGMNHGASVADLAEDERETARSRILEWAYDSKPDRGRAKPLAPYNAQLDKHDLRKERRMLP